MNVFIGVWTKERKIDYINVYKEYLGPNYVEKKDEYTTIIGNHNSWNVLSLLFKNVGSIFIWIFILSGICC